MNTLPIKSDGPFAPNTVEYVATLEDLQYAFPKLPPPEKVKDDEIRCPVSLTIKTPSRGFTSIIVHSSTMAFLTFHKMSDNGKLIWIYEGKVKL